MEEFNLIYCIDIYKYGMYKVFYKLFLKLINIMKLKKMMYICINKLYKIYIM